LTSARTPDVAAQVVAAGLEISLRLGWHEI
jgi:hypothetical protein